MRSVVKGLFLGGLLSIAVLVSPASSASFFYFKGPTLAPDESMCLTFSQEQARKHGLQNVKQDRLGVSGSKDNFFVNITCVGNIVVVMVAGDADANGGPLAKELFDAIRRVSCIDGC